MIEDHDTKLESGKMMIGGGLAGLTAITLNQWVAIATLIYFVIQILISIPKLIDTYHKLKKRYGRE